MEIKITKGAYERLVDVPVNDLPALSVANVVTIGFRNMPHVNMDNVAFDEATKMVTVTVGAEDLLRAGLTSILNDAHASVPKDAEGVGAKVDSLVDRKLAALIAGNVRVGGGGGRVGDPILRRAITIALSRAKAALPKGAEDKAIRRKARELVDANPAYRHLAEKQLAEEAALGIEPDDAPADDEGEAETEAEPESKPRRGRKAA